jgi:hypothetical protein
MGGNIFRTSRLFFINENGDVRVAADERVEVESGEGTCNRDICGGGRHSAS